MAQHDTRGFTAPAVFRARLGRHRPFLSESDAHAYERGWATFPAPLAGDLNTPEATGWFDAECAHLDTQDALRERAECECRR